MRAATLAATVGVRAERIEIVTECGLPMRRGFTLDRRLTHRHPGRGSARRLGRSHRLIHAWH